MSSQDFFKEISVFSDRAGLRFHKASDCALEVAGDANAVLASFISSARNCESWDGGPECELFISVLGALIKDGKINLSEQIEKAMSLKMNNMQLRRVLDEINEKYVLPAGLEITSHGLLRSFRFWSEDEKRMYVEQVRDVIADLREVSADVCLGYGGVLSIERSGDLSPHDDDLDVLVGFNISRVSTFGAGVKILEKALAAKGYQVGNRWPAFLKVKAKGMPHDIDVFVVLNEKGKLASIPGPRGVIPWESVFPCVSKLFMSVEICFPLKPEIYLEHVYGPDWMVPKRGWQHSWNYAKYADIT